MSIQWVPGSEGSIPGNAVPGGVDNDSCLYVARAFHKGSVVPGKFHASNQCVYISYGGREHKKETSYEVLTGEGLEWKSAENGRVPHGAVSVGREPDETFLYVARGEVNGVQSIGKVNTKFNCCHLPYGGSEHKVTKYEVLVDKEKADMAEAIRQSSDDSLRGLQRPGSDGTVALSTSSDPARLIEAGTMAWADLAPNRGSRSPCRPSSTVVGGVCWIEGAPGLLVFPPDFSGEVATEVATPETVAYYGAKFANRTVGNIEIPMDHLQKDFTYAPHYLETYVKAAKENGGAGGASLERHSFCHTDTPYEDLGRSGVFILGKFFDEAETNLELTGFIIPPGETLWVPAGVIHTNNYLKGEWNTMLNVGQPIDEVKLVKGDEDFSFTFNA